MGYRKSRIYKIRNNTASVQIPEFETYASTMGEAKQLFVERYVQHYILAGVVHGFGNESEIYVQVNDGSGWKDATISFRCDIGLSDLY